MTKHAFPLAAIALFCAILPSCATAMSNGIDGCEAPLLPPYRTSGDKSSDFAVSAHIGGTQLGSPFLPLGIIGIAKAMFAQGDLVYQWQPPNGAKGFCGAAALGGCGGYATSPLSDDPNWGPTSEVFFYGLGASLSLGLMAYNDGLSLYAPSIQFRYGYEGGPYFERRTALVGRERESDYDIQYINLKESRHAWVFSIVPYDMTFDSTAGDLRLSFGLGWNERWFPMVSQYAWDDPDALPGVILYSMLPTNLGFAAAFRFPGSGWYVGLNTAFVFDTIAFDTLGASLGAGYCW